MFSALCKAYRFSLLRLSFSIFIALAPLLLISGVARAFAGDDQNITLSVFDAFRLEMAANPAEAKNHFLSANAKKIWESAPLSSITDTSLRYLFSYSLNYNRSISEHEAVIAYINPWIDVVAFVYWEEIEGKWLVKSVNVVSMEIITKEDISNKNLVPHWLRTNGKMPEGMQGYYKKTIEQVSSFSLNSLQFEGQACTQECLLSLGIMTARFTARRSYIDNILSDKLSKQIEPSLLSLRAALASKNRDELQAVVTNGNPKLLDSLTQLPSFLTSSLTATWFIKVEGQVIGLLSSHLAPRLFLYVLFDANGRIKEITLHDWVNAVQESASTDK